MPSRRRYGAWACCSGDRTDQQPVGCAQRHDRSGRQTSRRSTWPRRGWRPNLGGDVRQVRLDGVDREGARAPLRSRRRPPGPTPGVTGDGPAAAGRHHGSWPLVLKRGPEKAGGGHRVPDLRPQTVDAAFGNQRARRAGGHPDRRPADQRHHRAGARFHLGPQAASSRRRPAGAGAASARAARHRHPASSPQATALGQQ